MKNITTFNSMMKKVSVLLLFVLTAATGMGQLQITCNYPPNISADTTTFYPWLGNGSGYMSGNAAVHINSGIYSVDSVAEKFTVAPNIDVTGAYIYFAHTTISSTDSDATIAVTLNTDYTGTGDTGVPNAIVASATIKLRQIAAAVTATNSSGAMVPVYVPFSSGYLLTAATVFVSVALPRLSGDTVALYTNSATVPHSSGYLAIGGLGWFSYDSLTYLYLDNVIQLATCPPPTSAPVAAFGDSIYPNCNGATVNFYDSTTNQPLTWNWTFTGGTPPTSQSQFPVVSYPASGTYQVSLQVSNALGVNNISKNVTVTSLAPPVTITATKTIICPTGDSSQISAPAGYTSYIWNTGDTARNITAQFAGNYEVTVTNNTGCTIASNFVAISNYQSTPVTVAVNGDTLTTGNAPPFQWYFDGSAIAGATGSEYIAAITGNYTLQITDAHGCSYTSSPSFLNLGLPPSGSLVYDSTIVNTPWYFCADSGSALDTNRLLILKQPAFGTTGKTDIGNGVCLSYTPANNFLGNDTFWMQVCNNAIPGTCDTDTVVMHVYSNCFQCVWPGDANNDGIVNSSDLLPIGIGYGVSGPARPNATILWTGQPSAYWSDSLPDSTNYKYIDCDGSGTINYNDTNAIVVNYSQTHTRSGGTQPWRSNIPALQIKLSTDTLVDGQTVIATLSLGDANNIATNVYGLAYTFNYDPIAIDSSSVSMSFDSSWLFGPTNHIALAKTNTATGAVDAAITRIDHAAQTGYGPLAHVVMKITTGNINGKNYSYYNFRCYISGLSVIDNNGNIIPVNEGYDSSQVAYYPTGIIGAGENENSIHVFPNPALDQLHIESDKDEITQWRIADVLGKQIAQQKTAGNKIETIDISSLSAGTYLLSITSGNSEVHSRFVKMR